MQTRILRFSLILASGIIAVSSPARAAVTYDEARVLDSTPIYRVVESSSPREECWEEEVARTERRSNGGDSATPGILGAVIGGAIGNAVGHGRRNEQVGTVVGAILGGSIGRDVGRNRDTRSDTYIDTVERCRTVYVNEQEEKLVGYDVRYSYNGSQHTVRMPEDPGSTVRVRVDVEPVL
ncbi:MAG: glycine zipper 2TM domain-containing protein [Pseudomonadota bacterium]